VLGCFFSLLLHTSVLMVHSCMFDFDLAKFFSYGSNSRFTLCEASLNLVFVFFRSLSRLCLTLFSSSSSSSDGCNQVDIFYRFHPLLNC